MGRIILILLVLMTACARETTPIEPPVIVVDSSAIHQLKACNIEKLNCYSEVDSLKYLCDSIKSQLFLSNYKIQKVDFYLKICLRDKTQDKFLKGWVRRTLE